jgi:hypothetical protein
MRIQGIYTGFSSSMSTGLTFGIKVPTGDWTYPNFDRDTELGSGSTDALIGVFHRGAISPDNRFSYFIQDNLDQPFLTQGAIFLALRTMPRWAPIITGGHLLA